jgi:hypothetical protein
MSGLPDVDDGLVPDADDAGEVVLAIFVMLGAHVVDPPHELDTADEFDGAHPLDGHDAGHLLGPPVGPEGLVQPADVLEYFALVLELRLLDHRLRVYLLLLLLVRVQQEPQVARLPAYLYRRTHLEHRCPPRVVVRHPLHQPLQVLEDCQVRLFLGFEGDRLQPV